MYGMLLIIWCYEEVVERERERERGRQREREREEENGRESRQYKGQLDTHAHREERGENMVGERVSRKT